MTPSFRGWIWSLAAVAGTATAVTLVYKYAIRGSRRHRDSETLAAVETQESEDVEYEGLSEDETDEANAEQQLVVVDRGRNMLLATFGLMLMALVMVVSLIVAWNNEDHYASFIEFPMFQPLMWIAVGILTATSTELLMRSSRSNSDILALEGKHVFPHDASDSELIRQHDREQVSEGYENAEQNVPRLAFGANKDDEEKDSMPEDVETIIKRADELFEQEQHARTREYMKAELSKYPTSAELWWRLARACNYLADGETNFDKKKAFAFEGLANAEKAYALNSNLAASNKWMAIMTSVVGVFCNLKEKIAGAYVIRDHIQRAIELDPTDSTSHNILGQWCLAFADMTWIEKRAAAALFGTPPTATYEEALQHFETAENISPGLWKKNVLLLAQTCMKIKRTKDAQKWVLKANAVPVKTKEDEEVARDVVKLMKQLKL